MRLNKGLGVRGFVLSDFLVVVVIAGLLACLAIPALLDRAIQANESAAIDELRNISRAARDYKAAYATLPKELLVLTVANPPLIDRELAGGSKNGYNYSFKVTGPNNFLVTARPKIFKQTGMRSFITDGLSIHYTKADAEPKMADTLLSENKL